MWHWSGPTTLTSLPNAKNQRKYCPGHGAYRRCWCGGLWCPCGGLWCRMRQFPNFIENRCNDINYMGWYEITYASPNVNSATVEVWEWISNFIPHFDGHAITHPCWGLSSSMLPKVAPGKTNESYAYCNEYDRQGPTILPFVPVTEDCHVPHELLTISQKW